jgi:Kdo2-lipid IVA lauroyltransferase/acyltransferase
MSKPRTQLVDYLVYMVIRLVVCVVQALPFSTLPGLAGGLAWLAYRVDRRHRLVAIDNLQHAFPGRFAPDQINRLVRRTYRHFCGVILEIIHLPRRINPYNFVSYLELGQNQELVDHLFSDRPLFMVTGHFGNWEMAGYVLGLLGFTAHAVARPLDNPFLDEYLRRFRERTGQKLLAKHGDFDKMQSILDRAGILATLADQDAGQRGLFVDFFGRPASTHKAVALLALEHRVPLIVIGARKIAEPMRYELLVEDFILPEEYENRADGVVAITQRFTSALERMVRKAPEQYFWLHRRWKHQPIRSRRQVA